jgi:type I restriction enzyme S subunit
MSVRLPDHLDLIAAAPSGIQKLRGLILELAVRGKLVPQNPDDEPASELLKRIAKERARQVTEGKIRKGQPLASVCEDKYPFMLPKGWGWMRLGQIGDWGAVQSSLPLTSGIHPSCFCQGLSVFF